MWVSDAADSSIVIVKFPTGLDETVNVMLQDGTVNICFQDGTGICAQLVTTERDGQLEGSRLDRTAPI